MDLVDFFFIFMPNVYVVDLMDLSAVYALLGDDPRFEIHGFLESHLQILW